MNRLLKTITWSMATMLLLVACQKETDELTASIPASATAVVYIDMKTLISKADYNVFENKRVSENLDAWSQMLLNEDAKKLLSDFKRNPKSLGVDFAKGFYLFSTNELYGVVMPISDAEKVEKVIKTFDQQGETAIRKEGDAYVYASGTAFTLVWNKHKLLFLSPAKTAEETLDKTALRLLSQKSELGIGAVKSFQEFEKAKTEVSFYTAGNFVNNYLKNNLIPSLSVSQDSLHTDMATGTNLSFEDGKIVLTSQIYFNTPEAETKYKQQGEVLQPINLKDKGFANMLSDASIRLVVGIDGETLAKQISALFGDDTDELQLLKYLDGQLFLSAKPRSQSGAWDFVASVSYRSGENFEQRVDSLLAGGMSLIRSSNDVRATSNSNSYFWTFRDGKLLIASSAELLKGGNSPDPLDWGWQSESQLISLSVDLQEVLQSVVANSLSFGYLAFASDIEELVKQFDRLEVWAENNYSSHMIIEMTNEKENSLAIICAQIDKLMNKE